VINVWFNLCNFIKSAPFAAFKHRL
jgi:hypothetical protein